MSRTGLADLAAWAEARLPRLIEDACAAVVDRIPMYRSDQPVPAAELRRSVECNLRFLVAAIGHPEAPLDLAAPQETGRRRAHQGAPLPEVLQAYRLSFATLWDALVEHARRSRQPATVDALLTASSMVWQLTDEHALALTEAYRAATAELLLARQRRRSALVEALLTGHPGPEAGPWEAATLLGLPPDGHLVVVAADTPALPEKACPESSVDSPLVGSCRDDGLPLPSNSAWSPFRPTSTTPCSRCWAKLRVPAPASARRTDHCPTPRVLCAWRRPHSLASRPG